jgi:methyltransferase (TIGR00027 family)
MTNTSRQDGDTWDLASSVGATATAVATSRALATRDRLIDDHFAEPLVRAVGMAHYVDMLDQPATTSDSDDISGSQRMAEGMAIRTRYFDEFVNAAKAAGIRQYVILASGLDARAYRLAWPAGTVVFEIDQPQVLDFKVKTLHDLGADPTTTVRNIPIDLRDDWPKALTANGFDTTAATAWLAEGLLMYLPPDAQDRLFDNITALSPSGSRLCTEFVPDMSAFGDDPDEDESSEDRWRRFGFKDDLAGLVYHGERSHVIEYLSGLDWTVTSSRVRDLVEASGFTHHEMSSKFEEFQYVSAILG